MTAQFGDRLEVFTFADLCDLISIVAQASIVARQEGFDELDMHVVWEGLKESLAVSALVSQAINLIDGFPASDATRLQRAIVETMETAE